METYNLQLIAVDETAQQAIELSGVQKFRERSHTTLSKLSSVMIGDHRHILVLSSLDMEISLELLKILSGSENTIVVLPDTFSDSEAVKKLILNGIRVLLSVTNSMLSLSLAQTLGTLERLFYGSESENEITLEHHDIYTVIGKGTLTEFYESEGQDVTVTMINMLNIPKSFDDVSGAVFLIALDEDMPLLEVVQALEVAHAKFPENVDLVFGTKNHSLKNQVKITAMVSRYYNFKFDLQKEIDAAESYFQKVAVIVDAYADGVLSDVEVEQMTLANALVLDDVRSAYRLIYDRPIETVKLIQLLGDENLSKQRKIEAVADVVINEDIDLNVVEALAELQHLSVDEIIFMIEIKRDGKLPISHLPLPEKLKEKYTDLSVVKSEETSVLLMKDEINRLDDGLLVVDKEALKVYETGDEVWYVSKELDSERVDSFLKDYTIS